ncbi:MAG: LytTR family DNA-binding domain-containing protein [Bacteroidota bacterium]
MKVLIIEDELPAARQLHRMLQSSSTPVEVLETLQSVEESVHWLQTREDAQLIFMDIQLADGISFDIFKEVEVKIPIIFTTAYNQFTLKAFKVNSIDYLLKPIKQDELYDAIRRFQQQQRQQLSLATVQQLMEQFTQTNYRERFLLRVGEQFVVLKSKDIAHLSFTERTVLAHTFHNRNYVLDFTLDQLEELLMPTQFFRINRGQIVNLDAVQKIHNYFGNRLKIDLKIPSKDTDSIVSRDRVKAFKQWMEGMSALY